MRAYTIPLGQLSSAHDKLLSKKHAISIGGKIETRRIKIVLISVNGDMEKMDKVCCHYLKSERRTNRRCNIPFDLSNDPLFECASTDPTEIIPHVLEIQAQIEQPESYNSEEQNRS